jgi:hypothetical protein
MHQHIKISVLTVSALLVLAMAACSVPSPSPAGSQSKEKSTNVAPQPVDATPATRCETTTMESIQLIEAALDRMDRATTANEANEITDLLTELLGQAGGDIGTYCGFQDSGWAFSEIIVWISREAATRSVYSRSWAEGFLNGVCDVDLELTPAAQVACSG